MGDLALEWQDDLSFDDTGDLTTVDGVAELRQRVIRRWLTSAGQLASAAFPNGVKPDDVFDRTYGGSARQYVDTLQSNQTVLAIQKLLLNQLTYEVEVSQVVPPIVNVTLNGNVITVDATVTLANGTVMLIPSTEVTA